MKSLLSILLLAAIAAWAFAADFPLYPGAVMDDKVSAALRASNPESAAYNSTDAFEKVEDFYKKLGGIDKIHSRNVSAEMKYAAMTFPGKHFAVQLSWNVHDKKHGTIIQFVKRP